MRATTEDERMVGLTFQLPPAMRRQIDQAARKRGLTRGEVTRQLIDLGLAAEREGAAKAPGRRAGA